MRLSNEKIYIGFLASLFMAFSACADEGVRVAVIAPESVGAQWYYPRDEIAQMQANSGGAIGGALSSLVIERDIAKRKKSAEKNLSTLGSSLNVENLKSDLNTALRESLEKGDFIDHYDPDLVAPNIRSIADYLGSIDEEHLVVLSMNVAFTPDLESLEITTIITKFEKSRLKRTLLKSKHEYKKPRPSKIYRHIYQSDFSTAEYSFERSVPLVEDLSRFYKKTNADIKKTKSRAMKTKKIKRRDREVKRRRQEVIDATLADSNRVLRNWSAADGTAIERKVAEGIAVLANDLPKILEVILADEEPELSSVDIYTLNFDRPINYFTIMDRKSVGVLNTASDRMTVFIGDSSFYSYPTSEAPRLYGSQYRRSLYSDGFEFANFYPGKLNLRF